MKTVQGQGVFQVLRGKPLPTRPHRGPPRRDAREDAGASVYPRAWDQEHVLQKSRNGWTAEGKGHTHTNTPLSPRKTEGGLGAMSCVDLTSEEAGLQYPAPKTRFSRERLDCSGPVSGPPLPSQEPLPGRVKLKGRGIEEGDKQCEGRDGAMSSVPRGCEQGAAR